MAGLDCSDIKRLISDYAIGNLPQETVAIVNEHFSDCIDCYRELYQEEQVMSMVERFMEHTEPPVGIWDRIYLEICGDSR